MPDQLMHLAYASNHGGMGPDALCSLVDEAQSLGAKYGLTGLLVVGEEDFFQLLEGPAIEVMTSFMQIVRDTRHHNVQVLMAGSIGARRFSSWNVIEEHDLLTRDHFREKYCAQGEFRPQELSPEQLESAIVELRKGAS